MNISRFVFRSRSRTINPADFLPGGSKFGKTNVPLAQVAAAGIKLSPLQKKRMARQEKRLRPNTAHGSYRSGPAARPKLVDPLLSPDAVHHPLESNEKELGTLIIRPAPSAALPFADAAGQLSPLAVEPKVLHALEALRQKPMHHFDVQSNTGDSTDSTVNLPPLTRQAKTKTRPSKTLNADEISSLRDDIASTTLPVVNPLLKKYGINRAELSRHVPDLFTAQRKQALDEQAAARFEKLPWTSRYIHLARQKRKEFW